MIEWQLRIKGAPKGVKPETMAAPVIIADQTFDSWADLILFLARFDGERIDSVRIDTFA